MQKNFRQGCQNWMYREKKFKSEHVHIESTNQGGKSLHIAGMSSLSYFMTTENNYGKL